MSSALEWAVVITAPTSAMLGVLGKSWFDSRKAAHSPAEETKLGVEAAQIIANTAVALVAPLKSEITDLTGRVAALEADNVAKTNKLQVALNHIRALYVWIDRQIPHKAAPALPRELEIEIDHTRTGRT